MGPGIVSNKMHFLIKCLGVALNEVKAKNEVLSHLISARTQKTPIHYFT